MDTCTQQLKGAFVCAGRQEANAENMLASLNPHHQDKSPSSRLGITVLSMFSLTESQTSIQNLSMRHDWSWTHADTSPKPELTETIICRLFLRKMQNCPDKQTLDAHRLPSMVCDGLFCESLKMEE